MEKAKVYFTKTITKEKVLEMYELLGFKPTGNVAIKLHSGEKGNQNFLRPDFWKPVIDKIGGTVVECNTAYPGARNYTDIHRRLISEHGWDTSTTTGLPHSFSTPAAASSSVTAWLVGSSRCPMKASRNHPRPVAESSDCGWTPSAPSGASACDGPLSAPAESCTSSGEASSSYGTNSASGSMLPITAGLASAVLTVGTRSRSSSAETLKNSRRASTLPSKSLRPVVRR